MFDNLALFNVSRKHLFKFNQLMNLENSNAVTTKAATKEALFCR